MVFHSLVNLIPRLFLVSKKPHLRQVIEMKKNKITKTLVC